MNRYFALLALVFLLPGVFAEFAVSSYTVSPDQVEPGEYGTIDMTITNMDTSYNAESIKVLIDTIAGVTADREVVVGDLAPGSSISLSIPFSVSENTKTGIYPVTLEVYGQVRKTGGNMATTNAVVVSSLKIVNPPAIQMSLTSSEIGEIGEQTITLSNNGGVAKKIYIAIDSEGIGFLNKDVLYISSINDTVSVPVVIDARNAEEGAQKIDFTIDYEDELGNTYSDTRSLPIAIRKESGDFVFTQMNEVVTGKEGVLRLEMVNYGEDISDLRISIQDGDVQFIGISEFKVGDVNRGEKTTFELPILPNTEPGSTSVEFDLKWVENNQNRESTKSVPVRVSSDADVGVYLEAKPAPLYTDSEHTISITVSNLGSYPIQATTVVLEGEGFTLQSIQPEQYIGGLSKDDFSSVQYKIKTGDADGLKPLTVTVKYRDASGEEKVKTLTTSVQVNKLVVAQGPGMEVVLVVIAIMAVAVYWLFIRPKGNKK